MVLCVYKTKNIPFQTYVMDNSVLSYVRVSSQQRFNKYLYMLFIVVEVSWQTRDPEHEIISGEAQGPELES